MDIKKEREAFEAQFKLNEIFKRESAIRNKDILEFSKTAGIYFNIVANSAWEMWQAAKNQAPQWIDYTKQSPHMNGRYQVFISGEQLAADWESPYGFSDPIDCCALIQEYISHWALLPEPPKTLEQK